MIRSLLCLLLIYAALRPALADPVPYTLDQTRSTVGFSYDFQGDVKTGSMPVLAADIHIDMGNLPASRVDVTLNADGAKAGFIFATQAMKSADVLDTARHPTIRFRSTGISGDQERSTVTGELTVRGITRPVTMQAQLLRDKARDPRDHSELAVLLTGQISRSAFGASGYPAFVGDPISLRILALIER